ncbi:MAG: hypothetical protein JW841_12875 [Deltaproteobacteria bacterium]|nr:hypothetical protein [Deltaproteobacteria bacterium]
MDRQRPDTTRNEIDLYIRTYYSLLRSTGYIRVRSLEETHAFSKSSLHLGARRLQPDISAFGYAATRLPDCMPSTKQLIFGQSEEQFATFGYEVQKWERVAARGRRRPIRYNGTDTLAVFIASASDIDDLVPIIVAYQIEWNKMHALLVASSLGKQLAASSIAADDPDLPEELESILNLPDDHLDKLMVALGEKPHQALIAIASDIADFRLRLLAASFNQYQRAAQHWWHSIESLYPNPDELLKRPVYFVSSNTHSLANLLSGYALAHKEELLLTAQRETSPVFQRDLQQALNENRDNAANYLYFVLREHIRRSQDRQSLVQTWDAANGIITAPDPGHIEVAAQLIEINKLDPTNFDPRLQMPYLEHLRKSDAVIINIDYPLGLAAYQLLSRVGQGIGSLRGIFVMGKAATLNGRVGDVMISSTVFDEHSKNTYILLNDFIADDIAPYLKHGSVLDNQKVLTVRGTFLQNRKYMSVFYREGYTVMEMEAGPYLSAIYELLDPRRHPRDEIINVGGHTPYPIGFLHYASDTPYSRRQSLLSRSLSYFGMDATYACATAIARRILSQEISTQLNFFTSS